jgi:hypothetical protein
MCKLRLWIHKNELIGTHYQRFQRWPIKSSFSSYAATLQPFPAYLGLVSCLVIVFVFYSAGMWNGNKVLLKGLCVYLAVRINYSENAHSLLIAPLLARVLATLFYNPKAY